MRLHTIRDELDRFDVLLQSSRGLSTSIKAAGLKKVKSAASQCPLESIERPSNLYIPYYARLLRYHLRTLYLFTFSDFKTIVIPSTSFTIFTLLSGSILTTSDDVPSPLDILYKISKSLVWTWFTLLVVDISNQWRPSSALEDAHNKPWRPVPSGRLSTMQARRLLLLTIPTVLAVTLLSFPEGLPVTILAIIGSYMYNDLGGADESFIMRNLMNAAAITCFASGSALVALGPESSLNEAAYRWLAIIGAIVTTTMQVQDMEDQEGDRLRGRATIPLLFGDMTARWTIAVLVPTWTAVCLAYWGPNLAASCLPVVLAGTIAVRTMSRRDVGSDKMNWRLWNVWMMSLYLLPVWDRFVDFGVNVCSQLVS